MLHRRLTVRPAIAVAMGLVLVLGACGDGEAALPVGGAPTTSSAATGPDDVLDRGSSAEIVVTEPGDVVFFCSIHGTPRSGMVGALRVVG